MRPKMLTVVTLALAGCPGAAPPSSTTDTQETLPLKASIDVDVVPASAGRLNLALVWGATPGVRTFVEVVDPDAPAWRCGDPVGADAVLMMVGESGAGRARIQLPDSPEGPSSIIERELALRVVQPDMCVVGGLSMTARPRSAHTLGDEGTTVCSVEAGDDLGLDLAAVGDVSGDGVDDFIVGAPGRRDRGSAYVIAGGSVPTGEWDLFKASVAGFSGAKEGDNFGRGVGSAGDWDGDGVRDVVVGARGSDLGGSNSGAVYVYRGPLMRYSLLEPPVVIAGTEAGTRLGRQVGHAGDVDADGLDDFVASEAAQSAPGRPGAMRGWGFAKPLTEWVLVGDAEGDQAGMDLAGVGDTNGDGFDDLLVGAHRRGGGAGAAYLVQGPLADGAPALEVRATVRLDGLAVDDRAGWALAAGGDLDQDGFDDVVVGAMRHDAGANDGGAVFVMSGPLTAADTLRTADGTVLGVEAGERAGFAVAGGHDVNGDGHPDLLVGAPEHNGGGQGAGAAYLFFGPVFGEVGVDKADMVFLGENAGDAAGTSVSFAGDLDQDGLADVLIGAPDHDCGGKDGGAVHVLLASDLL